MSWNLDKTELARENKQIIISERFYLRELDEMMLQKYLNWFSDNSKKWITSAVELQTLSD